jgi:predicted Holliday junction resolvase-like endonuclease
MLYFSIVLLLLVAGATWNFKYQLQKLKEAHEEELRREVTKARKDGKQRSAAVQWGKSIEHFVPFMKDFPVPVEDVTFLGMPIDYVGFVNTESKTKCEVHFIEVKSGSSFLMGKQKNIKKAIQEGRVYWHEMSVEGNFEK